MKLIFRIYFLLFVWGCHGKPTTITFPKGGFAFEKNINSKDSSFPFYPLRHQESIYDSTYNAFFTSWILKSFDEPNISLRPTDQIVLRLYFEETGSSALVRGTRNIPHQCQSNN